MERKGLVITSAVLLFLGVVMLFVFQDGWNKLTAGLIVLGQILTLLNRREDIKRWLSRSK